jgi:hypothetical protein
MIKSLAETGSVIRERKTKMSFEVPDADDYRSAARAHWLRVRELFRWSVPYLMAGYPLASGMIGCAQDSVFKARMYEQRARRMEGVQ